MTTNSSGSLTHNHWGDHRALDTPLMKVAIKVAIHQNQDLAISHSSRPSSP